MVRMSNKLRARRPMYRGSIPCKTWDVSVLKNAQASSKLLQLSVQWIPSASLPGREDLCWNIHLASTLRLHWARFPVPWYTFSTCRGTILPLSVAILECLLKGKASVVLASMNRPHSSRRSSKYSHLFRFCVMNIWTVRLFSSYWQRRLCRKFVCAVTGCWVCSCFDLKHWTKLNSWI